LPTPGYAHNYRACFQHRDSAVHNPAVLGGIVGILGFLSIATTFERPTRRTAVATVVESTTHCTTVESLTVALQVPNRHHPRSILKVLNDLFATTGKDSAARRVALLSTVALELLQRQASLHAASSQSKVCANSDEAQQEFSRRSIQDRSKIEADTGMFLVAAGVS
jgi:Protein of unknown function (DUF1517)